jgi:DNA-directed RNA polymerase subunit RPC12/RpoP
LDLEQVEITPWWKWFDRVLARKQGRFVPSGSRRLMEILQCADCGSTSWTTVSPQEHSCQKCGARITASPEGIFIYPQLKDEGKK